MSDAQEFARLQQLAPADAVAYLQRRNRLAVTYGWQDMWQDEHARQFTVSRLTNADLLAALQDKITRSVQGDLSRTDFNRDARQMLAEAGWWGKKEVIEPATGEILQTKFDPNRLKLIFDVNTRQAHAAGRWESFQRSKATHPFLRYITKRDERVRAAHRNWDNVTLPVDDPFWSTHYPPNGWRCRCRVVAVSQRDYDRGTVPGGGAMNKDRPDLMWKRWENRRTGQVETVPTGIDPGFGYNAGLAAERELQTVVRDKVVALPADVGAALWPTVRARAALGQLRAWQAMAVQVQSTRQAAGAAQLVHVVEAQTLQALAQRGIELESAAILMRDSELLHALRDSKSARDAALPADVWSQLPDLLRGATPYLDTQDQALIYALPLGDGRVGKVVVRLNYGDKARLGRERARVTANFVQTGGVVADINLTTGTQYMRLGEE
ncbi:phage minor head protein [Hydrogenophaga defluvii]|uniref:Phage minor head protein n=1 Tax=Hydrogenophaga defluvii TaxID=249410 RepID=A0ABW2S8T2_9BURK